MESLYKEEEERGESSACAITENKIVKCWKGTGPVEGRPAG